MADLESKTAQQISIQFTDDSRIEVEGYNAAYIFLHLKNATDLLPLLYRSTGRYIEEDYSVPLSALAIGDDFEPITK